MSRSIVVADADPKDIYRLMISFIAPRPIGWISTVSASGVTNVAPYSFFNMVSSRPPMLMFAPSLRPDGSMKDSLRNVLETKCFVHNVVTEELVGAMNQSSAEYGPEESEFAATGLTPIPSVKVVAPRVKEALIHVECRLDRVISLGDKPDSAQLVLGEAVCIHIEDESLITDRGDIEAESLKLVSRLGRTHYMNQGPIYAMKRPATDRA